MRHIVLAAFATMLLASSANAETKPASPDAGFVTQQATDRLASRLIGLNIQNPADETIGEIHDIVLTDTNAVRAVIVSVGGFLGIGTRYVAIDPKAITFNRQDEKNWKAVMNAT